MWHVSPNSWNWVMYPVWLWSTKDHDKLASLLKQHFIITLEAEDILFRGCNWGVTDFWGAQLAHISPVLHSLLSMLFTSHKLTLVSNKTSFKLPLHYVANLNTFQGHQGLFPVHGTLWFHQKKLLKGTTRWNGWDTILHAWAKFMHAAFWCRLKQVRC